MYTLEEWFAVAGIVLVVGAGLFVITAMAVIVAAGAHAIGEMSRRMAARAASEFGGKLDTSALAHAVDPGAQKSI